MARNKRYAIYMNAKNNQLSINNKLFLLITLYEQELYLLIFVLLTIIFKK